MWKHEIFLSLAFAFAGLYLTGCETVGQQRKAAEFELRQDTQLAQEEARRATARLSSLEEEIITLRRQMQETRLESSRSARAEVDPLAQRLSVLERRLDALDAARVKDREDIITALSKQLADALAKQASTAARSGGSRRPASSSGYGYEHTVKPGETLSAIAAAYKVTSKAIIDANDLKNPDRLHAGQTLFIPE